MTVLSAPDIAMARGGKAYSFLYNDVELFASVVFDATNWDLGLMQGTVATDVLVSDADAGGTWSTSVPLGAIINPTPGVHLEWSATAGVVVEYSLDGDSWTTAVNKRTILEDVDAPVLFIRVTVPTLEDNVSYLKIDVLANRVMSSMNGSRDLIFDGASMDHESEHQLSYVNDSGAYLQNGYIEIQPDTEETPTTVRSVEAWIRMESSSGTIFSAGGATITLSGTTHDFTGMTAYRNGAPVADGSFALNEWAHWVFVFNTANNDPIRLAGNMSVGHLATYDKALTAAEVSSMYKFNTVGNLLRVNDASKIIITEPVDPVDIYAYQWSFSQG